YRPKDIVSGDFYWFRKIGNKRIAAAIDCTGHGVPGAFMSMIGINLLEEIVLRRNILSPGKIMQEIHFGIEQVLHHGKNQVRDGMDAAVCIIDDETKQLYYAGARNPLVYGVGEKTEMIRGTRMSIGGGRNGSTPIFEEHHIELTSQQTTFYIYTDGFQDQFGGDSDLKLQAVRFRGLLEETHKLPIKAQHQYLETFFDTWKGQKGRQIDDVLVIGFKV
ncbi:MAG: SpoIIE family protein phosphatase, partial [Bacteroidota bacterium]